VASEELWFETQLWLSLSEDAVVEPPSESVPPFIITALNGPEASEVKNSDVEHRQFNH
jgi:hypothetical protein